jgi:hypothetical protein
MENIKLLGQAEITGKVFDGNEYFEMSAKGVDKNGWHCIVYWIFENNEKQLDEYDYSKINRIEYV